jgi:hypothetical protein
MFAWDLDVANEVVTDLPMGGNDITDAGVVSTKQQSVGSNTTRDAWREVKNVRGAIVFASQNADTESHTGTFSDPFTEGVQLTVDQLAAEYSNADIKGVLVGGRYDENVTLNIQNIMLKGRLTQDQIRSSNAGHIVEIEGRDVTLRDMTLNQENNSYRPVSITDNDTEWDTEEIKLLNISTEGSGDAGVYIDGARHVTVNGGQTENFGGDWWVDVGDSSYITLANTHVEGCGIRVRPGVSNITMSNIPISDASTDGLRIESDSVSVGPVAIDSAQQTCIDIRGDRVTVQGAATGGNQSELDYSNVRFDGDCLGSVFIGAAFGGTGNQDTIFANCTDCHVYGNAGFTKFTSNAVSCRVYGRVGNVTGLSNATRCAVNGHSVNNGNPANTGDWNGRGTLAFGDGITVWDTSSAPATPYKADPSGNWVEI